VEDLAQCAAYVGAAGNQSLGELLYFGKPVLALPERNHHEQLINSHFLRHMGVGTFVRLDRFRQSDVRSFMDRQAEFRERLVAYRGRLDGTRDTLAVIRRHLPRTTAPVTSLPREDTLAISPTPITQPPVPVRGVS
jgi:UDP:flavonoid glycosyltransferase YjiC (YdhE family)